MIKTFSRALAHFSLFSIAKFGHFDRKAFDMTLTMPVQCEDGSYEVEEFWGHPVRRFIAGDVTLFESISASEFECYIWHEDSGFEFEVGNENWTERPDFLSCLDPVMDAVEKGEELSLYMLCEALAGLYGGDATEASRALQDALTLS